MTAPDQIQAYRTHKLNGGSFLIDVEIETSGVAEGDVLLVRHKDPNLFHVVAHVVGVSVVGHYSGRNGAVTMSPPTERMTLVVQEGQTTTGEPIRPGSVFVQECSKYDLERVEDFDRSTLVGPDVPDNLVERTAAWRKEHPDAR